MALPLTPPRPINIRHNGWGVERVNHFVDIHLHCIVRNLKKISKMSMLPPMEKILRTPMAMAPCLPPLPYVAYCYQQSLFRCITCQDDCIQLPHATKRLLNANFLKITFAKRTFSDCLNGYSSRQQTSAMRRFSVSSYNYQSTAKQHHYHRSKISQNCYRIGQCRIKVAGSL